MYRQPTPREVLATTAAEIGKHLGVARCLVSVGDTRDAGQLTAEYSAPGVPAAGPPRIAALAALVSKASPDPWWSRDSLFRRANAPRVGRRFGARRHPG